MAQRIDDDFAFALAEQLVSWKRETGMTKAQARVAVAREARLAPGALQRLAAGRLKFTDRIEGALNDLLVATVERKIKELEHELVLAKARSARSVRQIDVAAVEAALAEARRALRR